jgi:hypothetical protein
MTAVRPKNVVRPAGGLVNPVTMDLDSAAQGWRVHGFVVLLAYLASEDLVPAQGGLEMMFPTPDGFHDGTDPRRSRVIDDEFAGIDSFPFTNVELSLLAVNDRLVRLARHLLGVDDLRIYSAEAWAKFTGAADYDQMLHRDYLNHTLLVPTTAPDYQQVEMFVFLVDVPEELGPPHMLSQTRTRNFPAKPNWYPRVKPDTDPTGFVSATARPDLYEAEVSGAGPAGTVIAFGPGTFHRGTAMTAPRGARYTMHLSFRPASVEWAHRHCWAHRSHDPQWYQFVPRATPQQLALFGFPPPGHPYWTPETLAGVAERYPGLDTAAWDI